MKKMRAWIILAVTLEWLAILARGANLRLNFSPSLPEGIYRAIKSPVERGSVVVVCLPRRVALAARARGYLAGGDCAGSVEALGKIVAAIAPDTVEVTDAGVRVNQRLVPNSRPLLRDRRGRRLIPWRGVAALAPGQIFLLATLRPTSFDSRYFGPICVSEVRSVIRSLPITNLFAHLLALFHRAP